MMKMGPNDTSGVVWALGEPFFFFFHIFLILTMILLYIEVIVLMFPPSCMKRARTMVYTIVQAVGMFFFPYII